MLGRFGLLLGLCLVLARCEEDEIIKCDGGECVKLHLCPNGTINIDGSNIIDIRFNPDNECEDYLLKCCPFPTDEDEIVEPPGTVTGSIPPPGTGPGSVPPTGTAPGSIPPPGTAPGSVPPPGSGPGSVPPPGTVPGSESGKGSGAGSVPSNLGKDPLQQIPGDTGKKPTTDVGGGDFGGGKPHGNGQGHGHGYGHGGCDGSCSSIPDSDSQTLLVGATEIPKGQGNTANQEKNPTKPPTVHGGGPPVSESVKPSTTARPSTTVRPKPGGPGASDEAGFGTGQKHCQQGTGASTGNPCHHVTEGTDVHGIPHGAPTQKPSQQGGPGTGGSTSPTKPGVPGINVSNSGIVPGHQNGGGGQHPSGPEGVKQTVGGGYNNGVAGTKPDATTQNPLDATLNVPDKCGFRNVDGVGFRITGGSDGESEYGEFPWMVAILKEEKALDQVINVYQCGASLIHPSVVLTAAHCVHDRKPEEVKVRLGEWDTQTKNEQFDYQDRNVVEIVSHANFIKANLHNDVALLFLEKPAQLMDTVNTICLPAANHNFDLSRCFASGWGKDVFGKQGTYQVILKKIELPIMPNVECEKALRKTRLGNRFRLHKSFICAGGEKGRDTCKGDGGSPLVCPIPGTVNQYYQAGMVAWGIGCGEDGIPGVYVNVPMFRGWIDEHLRQRNVTDSFYLFSKN